jgi:hypothetical protein
VAELAKGQRARVVRQIKDTPVGTEGVIFWYGKSKYGDGMRVGMKTDDGETHWVDARFVEPSDGSAPAGPAFPFRYYGHYCTDWIEGANDGHPFTIQLERTPHRRRAHLDRAAVRGDPSHRRRQPGHGAVEVGRPVRPVLGG